MYLFVLFIRITGSAKQGLIVAAIIGFVIFDVVYIASLMNYAIQSEMNIYLLQAIAKLTKDKKYNNFDESIKVRRAFYHFTSHQY